jgi:hypothetical protein
MQLAGKSIYDKSKKKWEGCPNLSTWSPGLESEFANFLNVMAKKCGIAMGIVEEPTMRWTAKYSTNILPGHEANRKPDLTLITHGTNADWRCIRSIGEMKAHRSQSTGFMGLMDQVSGMISLILVFNTSILTYIVCS